MIHRHPTSLTGGPTGRPRKLSPTPPPPQWQSRVGWGVAFSIFFGALVWALWSIVSILLGSAALAYLLDPIADKMEARGYSRNVGIAIIFATIGLILLILLIVLIPMIAGQFLALSGNIKGYADNLSELIAPASAFIETQTGQNISFNVDELKKTLPDWLSQLSPDTRKSVQDFIGQFFVSSLGIFTSIIQLALMPIFTFYLLSEWDRITSFIRSLIPLRHQPQVVRLAQDIDERLSAFVRGQITVCIVLGFLYSLGLWLSGVDLAFSVGLLAGALFIVPYLGTVVGLTLASLLSMMKFGFDIHLFYVCLAFGIPQFIESWYLTPKVVGNKVGLHPLVVMISLLAGGSLAGIWGMVLAIPLTATLDVLSREGLRLYRMSHAFENPS
jgi:predicted PurR-regulated permease PerM